MSVHDTSWGWAGWLRGCSADLDAPGHSRTLQDAPGHGLSVPRKLSSKQLKSVPPPPCPASSCILPQELSDLADERLRQQSELGPAAAELGEEGGADYRHVPRIGDLYAISEGSEDVESRGGGGDGQVVCNTAQL